MLSVICNRCTSKCSSVVVFWTRWLSFCSRFLYLMVSSVYCLLALSSSDVGTLPSRDFCNAAILNAAISWGQSKSQKSAEVSYSPQKRWPPSLIVKDQYIHCIAKSIETPPLNEQVFHSSMTLCIRQGSKINDWFSQCGRSAESQILIPAEHLWCNFNFRPWAKNSSPDTNDLYIWVQSF